MDPDFGRVDALPALDNLDADFNCVATVVGSF